MPKDDYRGSWLSPQFRSRKRALLRAHQHHVSEWRPCTPCPRWRHTLQYRQVPSVHLGQDTVADILYALATIGIGMDHFVLVDQGSSFGEGLAELCFVVGDELRFTGIKSYSCLNLSENYHQPLRTVYPKLRLKHPAAYKHLTLALTVKELNYRPNPKRFVPPLWYSVRIRLCPQAPRTTTGARDWKTEPRSLPRRVKRWSSIWLKSESTVPSSARFHQHPTSEMSGTMKYSSDWRNWWNPALVNGLDRMRCTIRTLRRNSSLCTMHLPIRFVFTACHKSRSTFAHESPP